MHAGHVYSCAACPLASFCLFGSFCRTFRFNLFFFSNNSGIQVEFLSVFRHLVWTRRNLTKSINHTQTRGCDLLVLGKVCHVMAVVICGCRNSRSNYTDSACVITQRGSKWPRVYALLLRDHCGCSSSMFPNSYTVRI